MWVLVVVNQETDEVEVRGPWDNVEEANGAAKGYRGGITTEGNEKTVRMAVTRVRPMAYFQSE